jgi:antitoxin component YwqK of YwqJK toxin-antitoxin module
MNLKECEAIFSAAIKKNLFKGNADAARRYLDAGNVEGFERVCRGNFWWFEDKDIAYALTDGPAENWYDNGQMREQSSYVNGKRHGEYTWWYPDGRVCKQLNYANGEMHGKYTWWYIGGQMRVQANYDDGHLHGKYTWWDEDGKVLEQLNYVNGVKQP